MREITPRHVMEVCQPGQGERTCRWLAQLPNADRPSDWACIKTDPALTDTVLVIVARSANGTMLSKGDNCEGWWP